MGYNYVIKQRQKDGTLWTSPEVFRAETFQEVQQAVVAGFIMGEARWAETLDDINPYFFLFGLNSMGKPCPTGTGDPDFSE